MAEQTPVLIAGAGPAGLALAIELGTRGISCVILERNDRVGYAPRAKTTHVRTREHLRRWGIANRLAAAAPFGVEYPSNIVFVTRLSGHFLSRIENAFNCAPAQDPLYSEHAQWIPQYLLEEVLREFAESLPSVQLRFNCELVDYEVSQATVRSRVRRQPNGGEFLIESRYLVGADGARSTVRELLGARMEGVYGLSHNYNIVFRAPGLMQAHTHGPAIMYWQINPDAPSLLGPMDTGDRWFFMPTGIPPDRKLSDPEAIALIRKATGIDLAYEILSSDQWVASRFIADRYRDGPVFLIGDACHLHPPFGGYGMNMGVSDSVDLGWKLAAVLQGWGGGGLLESYEGERRPVHQMVIEEAVANHALLSNQLWRDGLEDEGSAAEALRKELGELITQVKRREFKSLGVVLGYRYERSPVILYGQPARDTARDPLPGHYEPADHPGCLAPHLWTSPNESLYDLFGSGFTLLVSREGKPAELERAADDARGLGIPLRTLELVRSDVQTLYRSRFTLIRPDQHVAWRGESWPGRALLEKVSGA